MLTLVLSLTIAALVLGMGFGLVREPYGRFKEGVVVGGFLLTCLVAWWVEASVIVSWTVVALVGWWLMRAVTGMKSFRSLEAATWMLSAAGVGLVTASAGFSTGAKVLVGAGLLSALYGLAQRWLRWEPLKQSSNMQHHYAIGTVGNENMHGNFLCLVTFFVGWLSLQETLWWALLLPLFGLAIYSTRCKTAMLGLAVGWATLGVLLVGWLGLLGALLLSGGVYWFIIRHDNYISFRNTFRERLNYWRIAWSYIITHPLGGGFDHIRTEVPYIQRELNLKTKGEFLKEENYECPYPRRMHNDYLQHLADNGIVGFGLWLGVLTTALWSGSDPALVAGLVALMTCGVFFHLMYVVPSALAGWMLIGGLSSGSAEISGNGWLLVAALVGFLALHVTAKSLWASHLEMRYFLTDGKKRPDKVFELVPGASFMHTHLALEAQRRGNIGAMFYHTRMALGDYDGEQRLWELYHNLALACMSGGGLALAKDCCIQAITLWPAWDTPKRTLKQVDTIMEAINGNGKATTLETKLEGQHHQSDLDVQDVVRQGNPGDVSYQEHGILRPCDSDGSNEVPIR